MPPFGGSFAFPSAGEQRSTVIHKNLLTVTKATLSATETFQGGDTVTYYLSNDGGTTWEEVTNGTLHSFTSAPLSSTNPETMWRVALVGTGGANTYIEDLQVTIDEETNVT